MEKYLKIIFAEIVEAILFITLLGFCKELSTPFFNACATICLVWVLLGAVTPLIIWFRLEDK
jgi:hypothetical protein